MSKIQSTSGFVYIWYDRKHKRYYIGSHWGAEDDGYVCSSPWMLNMYKGRSQDFKRKILARVYTNRKDLLIEEHKWLSMIKTEELKIRYYNVHNREFGHWSADEKRRAEIGEKISKTNKGMKIKFKDPAERARKISETKKRKLAESGGFTDEHKAKLREKKLGSSASEEIKRKMSQSHKLSWQDPEIRQNRIDGLKRMYAKK